MILIKISKLLVRSDIDILIANYTRPINSGQNFYITVKD